MKKFKKIIAVMLTLALVIPGIQMVAPQLKEVKAAETSTEDVLKVKVQLKGQEAPYTLRLTTSLDSLDYKNAGFHIFIDYDKNGDFNGEGEEYADWHTNKVVRRIDAKTSRSGFTYNYSPKVIDTKSEYFVTGVLSGLTAEYKEYDILVKPYCTTLDGERVYGESRWFSIDDMLSANIAKSINIPVKMTAAEYNDITVDSTTAIADQTATIAKKFYDGTYAHFGLTVDDKTTLPSASEVTIGGQTIIYRNLYTQSKGNLDATADKSFYELYKDNSNEFIIATPADLYALSWIGATAGQKFYLVSDIELNDVSKVNWTTGEITSNYTPTQWRSGYFRAELDGQMHTISGLYDNTAAYGMFIKTYSTTILKNFKLVQSYINYNSDAESPVGSIVGNCTGGQIDTVYSNATVISSQPCVGGLAGTVSSGTLCINNSQYAGYLYSSMAEGFSNAGGMVGNNEASLEVRNSMFNGSMKVDTKNYNVFAGGIIGTVDFNKTGKVSTNILGCVSNGTYNFPNSTHGYAAVIGYVFNSAAGVKVRNTCYSKALPTLANNATNITSVNNVSEKDKMISGVEGWRNTLLNDDYFVAVTNATPELKSFSTREATELADVSAVKKSDIGWFNSIDKEFTLYTEEEFVGFMEKVGYDSNEKVLYNFEGIEIKLGADLVLNEGDASEWGTSEPKRIYNTIETTGYDARAFQGTFNGQGHSISGLYIKSSGNRVGLFKSLGPKSTIKNFKLINSYLEGTEIVGSVAARSYGGTIEGIYSDAIVVATTGACNGGIIGQIWHHATNMPVQPVTIKECWYDGDLYFKGINQFAYTGGILGENHVTTVTIENCLYSGNIIAPDKNELMNLFIGGIHGATRTVSGVTGKVIVQNCISVGGFELSKESDNGRVAMILGDSTAESTVVNCYGSSDSWKYAFAFINGNDNTDVKNTNLLPKASMLNNQLPGFGTEPWVYIKNGTPELRSFMQGREFVPAQ